MAQTCKSGTKICYCFWGWDERKWRLQTHNQNT